METLKAPSPPLAVSSVIISMGLVAAGSGLIFTYIPLKLASEGFEPWVSGTMLTAMAAGGFVGCIYTGHLVRRVGHARVFALFAAIINLSALVIALGAEPFSWIAARLAYGFAINGLFVVTQSWLNHAAENEWRGKVIAIFYMTYIVSMGAGSFSLSFVSLDGPAGPMLAIFFTSFAILPVALTRLENPPPPERVSLEIRTVWRTSQVGLVGLLAVGGMTVMVQGFAPIYASAENFTKDEIALLMFLMQFGMIGIQFPLGALSDRIDRRYVLVGASLLVVVMAGAAIQMSGLALVWVILVFAVWSGATESIYAVANAHANDRADPKNYVAVSSTLLVAWSASAFLLPGVATVLTPYLGPTAFMYVVVAVALLYGAFVAYRLVARGATPEADQEPYQPITAQAPYSAEVAPQPPEETAVLETLSGQEVHVEPPAEEAVEDSAVV